MDAAHPVHKFAVRRPDWALPEVHAGLQLTPLDVLRENKERIKCPKCGRSRAHYCYDCLEPLVPCPHVALPFRVSIVTHHEEKASKNTGVQVAILAAGQVDLHSMSEVPSDVDPSRCAVLFPSDSALEVADLEPDSVDRLFIIDSRWKKAGELVRSETFRTMRAVKLSQTRSAFWRFHTRGVAEEGVCTVEALYFFLDAMAKKGKLTDPRFTAPHAFDNLLWYFVYQHEVVQQAAQQRAAMAAAAGASGSQARGTVAAEGGGKDGCDPGQGPEAAKAQRNTQQQQTQKQQKGKQQPGRVSAGRVGQEPPEGVQGPGLVTEAAAATAATGPVPAAADDGVPDPASVQAPEGAQPRPPPEPVQRSQNAEDPAAAQAQGQRWAHQQVTETERTGAALEALGAEGAASTRKCSDADGVQQRRAEGGGPPEEEEGYPGQTATKRARV